MSAPEASYTFREAAGILRVSERKLGELSERRDGLYHSNGNRKLFTETEIGRIRKLMAKDAKARRKARKP